MNYFGRIAFKIFIPMVTGEQFSGPIFTLSNIFSIDLISYEVQDFSPLHILKITVKVYKTIDHLLTVNVEKNIFSSSGCRIGQKG